MSTIARNTYRRKGFRQESAFTASPGERQAATQGRLAGPQPESRTALGRATTGEAVGLDQERHRQVVLPEQI